MCGIFAVFGITTDLEKFRPIAVSLSKRIRHRGPDWSGIDVVNNNNVLCHERLAIVGVDSGAQPLKSSDGSLTLCVNGEIYNYAELKDMLIEKMDKEGRESPEFLTGSDCEIILHLYKEFGIDLVHYLRGMYAFVLYDKLKDRFIAARDPVGIVTLYQGKALDGSVWFASEMKSIFEYCSQDIVSFEPGMVYDSLTGKSCRWFQPTWWNEKWTPASSSNYDPKNLVNFDFDQEVLDNLRLNLEESVESHMMSEVPYGVLLSGGLDSSLIASIASRISAKWARKELNASRKSSDMELSSSPINERVMWSSRLHSFSIGLKGSPDLKAARQVANLIGTKHHEFTFTVQEGIDAIRDVIYHLETYDVTTIRASTPMYLMSRKIKATGVKMVLSGEGADEIFGGYLYFHQAPSPSDLHVECVKRVKLLHTSDCLRANKSTMAWGLEARVPFLDSKFLDVAMTIPPEYKHPDLTPKRIEKEVLRKAFDVSADDGSGISRPYLPKEILWRQKEQFSDGVGYSWIDTLREYAASQVSDEMWNLRQENYPFNCPTTREALFYRMVFEQEFCPAAICPTIDSKLPILKTVVPWVPRRDWGCAEDPSGRAQKAHANAYESQT